MNALHYLLQANLYLALFYGFYYFWLRRETFHQLNRAYLLAAAALSLFIPVLQSDWVRSWFLTERVHEAVYTYYDLDAVFVTALPQQAVGLTWGDAFAFVYMAGVLVGLGRLSFQLAHLQRFLSRRKSVAGRVAFSFFNHLVVGRHLDGRDTILIHERVHARQLHSADVLLVELLAIFNWFNPAVYAYRQSLRAVHEFIADQQASRHAPTKADYALLLFAKQFGISPQLTNSFFSQSLLRRRVAMLQKAHSPRRALLKYGLTAPLFGAMLVFSSAAVSDSRALEAVEQVVQSEQPLRAIPLVGSEPDGTEARFPDLAGAVALSPELQRAMRRDTVESFFTVVEEPAQFPGGTDALWRFLARNLLYPTEAKAARATGKVFVRFIVETNGTVTHAEVIKGIGHGADEEALRVVRLMPAWKPGRQSGRAVRSQFIVPFTFAIDGQQSPAEANPKTDSAVVLGELVAVAYPPKAASLSPVLLREMRGDTVEPLFTVVERQAQYPGGVSKLMKFLRKNLTYPIAARQSNVQGKVFVSFIIEKDGAISTVQVMKGLGFGCDEEAVRVVEAMPRWTPGKQSGQAVRSRFTLPIIFSMKSGKLTSQIEKGAPSFYLIDGEEVSRADYGRRVRELVANDVRRISARLLEPGEAVRAYGTHASAGVMVIETSRNQKALNQESIRRLSTAFFVPNPQTGLLTGSHKPAFVLVDGKEYPTIDPLVTNLRSDEVTQIEVYKDGDAVKKFGERAREGVLVITTKKK